MPLAARHRDDPPPELTFLPGFAVRREVDAEVMARLQGRSPADLRARMDEGHTAWVASVDGEDVAWGWVASRRAHVGELNLTFDIPPGERYLWNFVTSPRHRGRGIYPRLLDAIVRAHSAEADRFWIIRAPENRASGSGIERAGFVPVAILSFDGEGRPAAAGPEAEAAARLLSVARSRSGLAPCWRCAREGRPWLMFCGPSACACDYQRPERECS